MTQQEADALIHRYIDLACRAEAKRDAQRFESAEYWRHHDKALLWHGKAEALMPREARTIHELWIKGRRVR